MYAREYIGGSYFRDIFIIDVRNSEKTHAYYASSGTIKNSTLILLKGERVEIDNESHKDSIMQFQSYKCDLREILNVENKQSQANEKFIDELLLENGNNQETIMAQKALFHQKMTSPLLTIIFSLLAFFLILQAPYERKPSLLRRIGLVFIIVVFQVFFFWIANASAKSPALIVLNYVLIIGFILVLIILVVKKRKLIELKKHFLNIFLECN